LADLAARLKLGKQEEERWTNLKQHLTNVLLEELWDGDSFLIKNALTGETRKSTSLLRLMPLVAARHLPVDVVEKMSTDLSKHLTQWGLATEELESSLYEADGYWRGPIWVTHGRPNRAGQLHQRAVHQNVRKGGFLRRTTMQSVAKG
jgi:glycogen debranching enzyme